MLRPQKLLLAPNAAPHYPNQILSTQLAKAITATDLVPPIIHCWTSVAKLWAWVCYSWQIRGPSLWQSSLWAAFPSKSWLSCPWADLRSIVILFVRQTFWHPLSFCELFPTLHRQCSLPDLPASHLPTNLSNSKNPSFCTVCRHHYHSDSGYCCYDYY